MMTNNLILNFGMMIRIRMKLMRSRCFKNIFKHLVDVNLACSTAIVVMLMCVKAVSLTYWSFSADFLRIMLLRAIRVSYAC